MNILKPTFALAMLFVITISCANSASSSNVKPIKGKGPVVEKTHNITADFTTLEAKQAWKINLIKADESKVVVRTHENLQQYVSPKVKNGKLTIEFDRSLSFKNIKTQEVDVYYKNLSAITAKSASSVKSKEVFDQKKLDINSSSASSIDLILKTGKTTVKASSAARVKLSGTSITFNGEASSAASIKAKGLKVKRSKVKSSSASTINIHVLDSLSAKASGAATINYYGQPKEINTKKSGAASINQKSL